MTEQTTTTETPDALKDAQTPQDTTGQQAPTPVPAEDQKKDLKDAQEDTTPGDPQDALGKLRKEAAGHRDAVFHEDGTLNTATPAPAIKDTAARFRSTRHQAPDPTLGRETIPGGGSTGTSWHAMLAGR